MATIAVPSTELHLVTLVGLQLTGQAPTVAVGTQEDPQDTPLVLTGAAPSAEITHNRAAGAGSLALASDAPLRLVGNNTQPTVGALTLTGIAPSAEITHNRSAGAGSLALNGIAPFALVNHIAAPGVVGASLASDAPSAEITHNRATSAGALTLTGLQPTVSSGANIAESPGAGSLSLNSDAPSSDIDHIRQVGAGSIALTGASTSVGRSLSVPAGSLSLTGQDIEGSKIAQPTVVSLEITALAPGAEIANAGVSITNPNATAATSNYEQCDYTGFRVLPGELVETGYGKWVRRRSHDPKHPQDLVRSLPERRQRGPQRAEQDDAFVDTVTADEL